MTPSTSLSRMRLAGKLCRRGAWIIAATGLAVILFIVISSVSSYVTSNVSSGQPGPGQNFNDLLTSLAIALLLAIAICFFFLVLSAVGALLDYMSTEKNPQEANDERVEITSLPKMR